MPALTARMALRGLGSHHAPLGTLGAQATAADQLSPPLAGHAGALWRVRAECLDNQYRRTIAPVAASGILSVEDNMSDKSTKTKPQAQFGSYKRLGIDKPKTVTANDICPICSDTASKRKLGNPCAFEIHKLY